MRKDLIIEDGELAIEDGDFVIAQSDLQHLTHLIRLSPGNIKEYPTIGYGDERLLNGTLDGRARRDIQSNALADGYSFNTFTFDPELQKIEITI